MTDTLMDTATPTSDAAPQDATQPAAPSQPTGTGPEAGQGAEATATADNPPAAESDIEYEPFKAPEGVLLDEELLGEFKATAKELKLSQEDAQRLADIGVKMQQKQVEAYQKTQAQWIESVKADNEIGGQALDENLAVAKKALGAFATPELRQLLNESGFGNHPEVIRHFVRVGKAISEDGRVVTGTKAAVPSDPAKRLFPNQA